MYHNPHDMTIHGQHILLHQDTRYPGIDIPVSLLIAYSVEWGVRISAEIPWKDSEPKIFTNIRLCNK